MTESPQMVDLDSLLDQVADERSFIAFVEALANDFAREQKLEAESSSDPHGSGHLGWENGTVDAVLGAAAAWGRIKLLTGASTEASPWKRCAHILYAGKFYE